MKSSLLLAAACLALVPFKLSAATTHYVDAGGTNALAPYTNWSTAATNIQDAIDVSTNGDTVLVTNGIYRTGGRIVTGVSNPFSGPPYTPGYDATVPGSQTNRVAVTKAIILQSVNGPKWTIIEGAQGTQGVRCAYLTNGATLSGFTLTNGAAWAAGGGAWCLSDNAFLSNCIVVNNWAPAEGGGVFSGTVENCILLNNHATYAGGGALASTLNNSVLTGNTAGGGGGGSGGGASFCVLNSCTVVSNLASASGGGVSGGVLNNCVVYDNGGGFSSLGLNYDFYYYPTLNYCCTTPMPTNGVGNITNDPAFVNLTNGNFHLQAASRCINTGNNSSVVGSSDLDGNPRIMGGTVDIGAYEFQGNIHYVSLSSTNPVAPYSDWSIAATNIQDAVAAAQAGEIVVVSNGIYKSGGAIVYGQESNRVALTNSITLLSLNGPLSTVIVGTIYGSQTRCVYVGSNAVLSGFSLVNGLTRSSGDAYKELSGGGAWCETGGVISNCIFGGNNFPYANGGTPSDGCTAQLSGGGVYGGTIYNSTFANNNAAYGNAAAAANLVNCIVSNNLSSGYGGGIYQGVASNCVFSGNSAYSGGGGYQSILFNCTLSNNMASGQYGCGGGTYQCTNYNCALVDNSASIWGGGAYQSALYNCFLTKNIATNSTPPSSAYGVGGGALGGTLWNCILTENAANVGGGAAGAVLYNCNVVSNWANLVGGGVFSGFFNGSGFVGAFYNCIIYYNNVPFSPTGPNHNNNSLYYCDTTPAAPGPGNITNEPAFLNLPDGDLHLQSNSPCINAGNNAYATRVTDFDGNPRIVGCTVDVGAYEFQSPASIISYAWLQQYGLPTDGSADYADLDGTGMSNWQKSLAGLNPTDPASVLAMISAASTNASSGITVSWQSVSSRTYYLQRASNLAAQPAFSVIQSNIVGQAGTTSYTDASATNGVPYFYRVGVQ